MNKDFFKSVSRGGPAGAMLAAALIFGGPAGAAEPEAAGTNGFYFAELSKLAAPALPAEHAGIFSVVPAGVKVMGKIPFHVGPPYAVTGMEQARAGDFFPTELRGIPVGRAAKRVHLLVTLVGEEKDGTPFAQVVFRYAGGETESVRLAYGVHAREWLRSRAERTSSLADPNCALAWSGAGEERGAETRLYQTALVNPRPGEAITSLDFVSLFSRATPVLFAVSMEAADSALPPSQPVPTSKAVRDARDHPETAYRREFVIRATDGENGGALTNATALLTITDDAQTFFMGEASAEAGGVCRLPYPPQHALAFTLLVRAPDRVPGVFSESLTNKAAFSKEFTAALKSGVRIGGMVKAPDGKPIAGAEVLIHQVVKTGLREYRRTDFDIARTGADGKWSSASVPAGFTNFNFQVSHPEFRPVLYSMSGAGDVAAAVAPPVRNTVVTTEFSPGLNFQAATEELGGRLIRNAAPAPVRQRVITTRAPSVIEVTSNALASSSAEFTLQPAIRIEGILFGQDAKPIPFAEIVFQRNNPNYERRHLRTDADGRFRLITPDPGDGALIVVRDGHTPKYQYLNIEPGLPPLELRLEPARTFRGRIIDRQQRPVAGARVRLDDWQGTADLLLRFQALTDSDGRFAWTGAPPDQVTFQLSKTNCSTTRHSFSPRVNEMTFTLNRFPGISGSVLDADTRQPVESFTLTKGRKYNPSETQLHWERYNSTRGRGGEYWIRVEDYYFQPEARLMVEAPGYVPEVSPGFTSPGTHTHDFLLKKGRGLTGTVRAPDGSPAVGATVVLVSREEYGYMDSPGQFQSGGNNGESTRTDSQGRFEFSPRLETEGVLAAHDLGFVEAPASNAATNLTLTLKPWARVRGVMRVGDRPDPEHWVVLQNQFESYTPAQGRATFLSMNLRADPEADGRFAYDKVPPGLRRLDVEYKIRERNYDGTPLSHGRPVQLKAGETNQVNLGGTGRQVVGRVKVLGGDVTDVDWRRDLHRLVLVPPPSAQRTGLGAVASLLGNVFGGAPGPASTADQRNYILLFETNGTFRADHVPPGNYLLQINATDPEEEYYNRRPYGSVQKQIEIPDEPGAKVNAPFDLGPVEMTITPKLKIGRTAPDFEAKTFDGKPVKLSEHRGKHVLLFFWASYAGLGSYDLNVLRELHTSYGAQGKLVVLGLNLDSSLEAAANFARTQNMSWPQLHLGEWGQSKVPPLFNVDGFPTGLLLDTEGKLVARQLRGTGLRNAVRNALDN